MRRTYGAHQAPEGLLTLFGTVTAILMGMSSISLFLVIPASIAILAGLHLFTPKHPTTVYGLGIAYVVGGFLAGLLLLAAAIAPIGGDPDEVTRFYTAVFPLIGIYTLSVLSLVVKFR